MKRLFAVLCVISVLAFSTIAHAATGFVDPNGDSGTPQFQVTPGGTHYTTIDDGTRYNDTPNTADYVSHYLSNKVDIFNMSTLTGVGTVSNVTVWVYGKMVDYGPPGGPYDIKVNAYLGGTYLSDTLLSLTASNSWKSASFNGSWTQTDLDNMLVKLTSYTNGMNVVWCYAMYAVVTYTAGGGGGATVTGKVIMISEDGEGSPPSGYNNDYVSVYPPAQSDTYVKATSTVTINYYSYFATDPTKPLISTSLDSTWESGDGIYTNQRFHIDLGSAKIVTRIYYENFAEAGILTNIGVKNFTLYGSNTSGDFTDLTYADTGDWVELTCSQNTFDQHTASDVADPKYITVANTTSFRYYGFRFADNWGNTDYMGVRRIELQTAR